MALTSIGQAAVFCAALLGMLAGAAVAEPARGSDAATAALGAKVGEEWPRWRGPRGNGTWNGPKLPEKWPEAGLRRVWRPRR